MDRTYIAIDLKSFFASVECVKRGLDPLDTNLVVADKTRTEKTICLAVSPSLKAYGIGGRARLFEVIQVVEKVNNARLQKIHDHRFFGESYSDSKLKTNPDLKLTYIVAPPQMKKYIKYSNCIFNIYKKFVSPKDIHKYSVDEVFIDATSYLKIYNLTAREFCNKLINEILKETGIIAAAGIGPNMYLCKIAMDIMAKKIPADKNGVRIAELTEESFKRNLWEYVPLTSFWGIGKGIADRLAKHGIYTMGDIAFQSVENESILYEEFGIEAEILIDHAWGLESCTIQDIKEYKTDNHSISNGQVLKEPYDYKKGRIIVKEMANNLCYDLLRKNLETDQVLLTVGYDKISLSFFEGETIIDRYGGIIPKSSKGSKNLLMYTSSEKKIIGALTELYDNIADKKLFVRRMSVTANHVRIKDDDNMQLSFYDNNEELLEENKMQNAVLKIKNKYGKNAILKGIDLKEGATTIERNGNLGGHKA